MCQNQLWEIMLYNPSLEHEISCFLTNPRILLITGFLQQKFIACLIDLYELLNGFYSWKILPYV